MTHPVCSPCDEFVARVVTYCDHGKPSGYHCGACVDDKNPEVQRLRDRVAELEAEVADYELYQWRDRAKAAEAREAELEAERFEPGELRRIIQRVMRKPRNGQDYTIAAKCHSALRGEGENVR
ncbi:MAG: hypothetical protein ACYTAN_13785 [Planctomycetota bacterium]|jgi:hypothetical protein